MKKKPLKRIGAKTMTEYRTPAKRANTVNRRARIREEKTERRRRKTLGVESRLKLHVQEEQKDKGYEYRWINDDGMRMHNKTVNDDWDIVHTGEVEGDEQSLDSAVTKVVGTDNRGNPIKAFLCRKKKDFCEEDMLEKRERRKSMMNQIGQGEVPGADTSENGNLYIKKTHGIRRAQ